MLLLHVHGYPTHLHVEDVATGTVYMQGGAVQRPIKHLCYVTTTRHFLRGYLGIDHLLEETPTPAEWLALREQLHAVGGFDRRALIPRRILPLVRLYGSP